MRSLAFGSRGRKMSYKISISNINGDDKYKATLIGKNSQDGKFYFVSTFNSEEEANNWLKEITSRNRLTQVAKSEVVENDGFVVVSGVNDAIFEAKSPELDEEEPKSPRKKRAFYENIWDAFRRMW
jgi:hypothetical protein